MREDYPLGSVTLRRPIGEVTELQFFEPDSDDMIAMLSAATQAHDVDGALIKVYAQRCSRPALTPPMASKLSPVDWKPIAKLILPFVAECQSGEPE